MKRWAVAASLSLVLVVAASACATSRPQSAASGAPSAESGKKQIAASIFSAPAGMHQELTNPQGTSGSVPGLPDIYQLVGGGLTYLDGDSVRHPWIADTVPSVENGLWKVSPDGQMETTWHIKPGVEWQDGTPLTSDDLRFTVAVYRDRDIGVSVIPGIQLIEGVDLPDPQTAVVKWREPFISADGLFSSGATMWVLPRHILEAPFNDNKDQFLGLPYWEEEFVGLGPFKIVDWESGSSMMLAASDNYFLGRPKIDQIEVRFIGDRSTIVAGLLAGSLQTHIGRGLNPIDIIQLRDRTQDVKVQLGGPLGNTLPIYPQFINPDPAIVGNVQFRRALLMAIDRQEMTDTLNSGLGPISHSWVPPDQPEGKAIDGSLVRYDHDPAAATRMIEGLGYAKDADGIFHGPDGAKLSIPLLTHRQNAFHEPATLAVARYWKEIGLDVQVEVLPVERASDLQYRALYSGFFLLSRGLPVDRPDGYFSRRAIPTADNNYRGGNAARYGTPELDALIQSYLTTIPFNDRMVALGDMVHIQTDQVTMLPLFWQGSAFILGSSHLHNVLSGQVWNANEWDMD